MVAAKIAELIAGPVMIVVSTADRDLRPAIGRGTSAVFHHDSGLLDLLVSRVQWADVFRDLERGAPIATTFISPQTYVTFQIKGRVQQITAASGEEVAHARAYVAGMFRIMELSGVTIAQFSHTMALQDLMRIRLFPTDLFNQTPGPGAGSRLREEAEP